MIELKHLRKEYEKVIPFKDVNVTINDGDVISIIGPSGTGKSTLLRCINLLETPTSGQVILDGVDITDSKIDINQTRQKIGMVFQSFNLYEHLSIIENVMLAQTKLLKKTRQEAYDIGMQLLEKVGLKDHSLYYPAQLSGGQRQRAAIARTLATNPSIILFDEPTSALDPLMVGEVEKIIEQLAAEGRTMMIVTHEMSFAKKVANRVFYLDEGGIYEEGTPQQIFENPQKEKTKKFIFHLSNYEIIINQTGFDREKAIGDLYEFGKKNNVGERRMNRLLMVLEEGCVGYVKPCMKEDSVVRIVVSYKESEDKLILRVSHNIPDNSNKNDDEMARCIIKNSPSDIRRVPLTPGEVGMLDAIEFEF